MQHIKSFFKFVFVYRPLREYQAHATGWQAFKYHSMNGFRRIVIALIVTVLATGPAYLYHEWYPKIVLADPIVKEVPAEAKLADYPILVKICNAESGGKQFKANGDVVRGAVNPSDVGLCQISESINNDEARRLRFDIFTEKGNIQMAIHMFVNQGTQPWKSSQCIKNGWGTAAQCK